MLGRDVVPLPEGPGPGPAAGGEVKVVDRLVMPHLFEIGWDGWRPLQRQRRRRRRRLQLPGGRRRRRCEGEEGGQHLILEWGGGRVPLARGSYLVLDLGLRINYNLITGVPVYKIGI